MARQNSPGKAQGRQFVEKSLQRDQRDLGERDRTYGKNRVEQSHRGREDSPHGHGGHDFREVERDHANINK